MKYLAAILLLAVVAAGTTYYYQEIAVWAVDTLRFIKHTSV